MDPEPRPPSSWETPAWASQSAPEPPPPAAPPRRSAWITTSSVVLFVVAALSGLIGVVLMIFGLAIGPAFTELFEATPGVPTDLDSEAFAGVFTGFMVGFGVIAVLWAVGHVAAGVGILGGHGWARITGMVLAAIGLLFSLLVLVSSLASIPVTMEMMRDPSFAEMYGTPAMTEGGIILSVVLGLLVLLPFVVGYLIVLVTLIRSGTFFDRRPLA